MSVTVNTPSSRGSWSSLFNTGSVRQFMAGAQTSPDTGSPGTPDGGLSRRLPVPGALKPKEPSRALSQSPLKRGVAKSWSESSPRVQRNTSVTGTRGPTPSESPSMEKVEKPLNNKKLVVVLAVRNKTRWEMMIHGPPAELTKAKLQVFSRVSSRDGVSRWYCTSMHTPSFYFAGSFSNRGPNC